MHSDGMPENDAVEGPKADAMPSGPLRLTQCPKAALFDLDETLSRTLQAPEPEMTARLLELHRHVPVAILTGRDFDHIQTDFLDSLASAPQVSGLYVLASGCSEGYGVQSGLWERLFFFELSGEEKAMIRVAVDASVAETNILQGLPCFGERYVDKGSMISFAMLGVPIPPEVKRSWDPGNAKRSVLWKSVCSKLPNFDVAMGGMTAIDITKKGINKAYGVRWLSEHLSIPVADMLYVGDALFPGGNDQVVTQTGIPTRATDGPEETLGILDELLALCRA